MVKVLVLYYSAYGHVEAMARAVAEGAREAGASVAVKRVPELVPEEIARKSGFKLDQEAPIATVRELPDHDAIIFGTPDPLRQHVRADAQLPRSGRRPAGGGQARRQGGKCL